MTIFGTKKEQCRGYATKAISVKVDVVDGFQEANHSAQIRGVTAVAQYAQLPFLDDAHITSTALSVTHRKPASAPESRR
ncbi:hypothetical protein BB559_003139 [Furculomyces boomerangus]|uniref:Uncharacterized protein n=1 Tax=Furculomyces boomerangus TaxID=61424 RepID=A0A2T9YAS5_9FUNG|nr:hypothetical protein BB559_005101 [Furculomyces boomerangus]PVU93862.1 hypothetical protein BB559_003139 [Furculomyces boomerangus]